MLGWNNMYFILPLHGPDTRILKKKDILKSFIRNLEASELNI